MDVTSVIVTLPSLSTSPTKSDSGSVGGILDAIGMEHKGLHTFRHTFATRLINGVKQPDGSVKSLSVKQVAELLGHTTSEITEIYYVKRDNSRLAGLTDSFNL